MEIVRRVHSMREIAGRARARGLKVGLVPTMGSLHEGHLSLIRRVDELADVVVVSVFVNPTQFGPGEDYDRYPRDLARDADFCVAEGVDYLFAPEVTEIYPPGPRTHVEVEQLSDWLEGASRPGHFRGVATVVLKLFNIVQPTIAAFGQKDAQQAVILRRVVEDLMLNVELLVLPIVRDEGGLALSSRNARLSDAEQETALAIPRALQAAEKLVAKGETKSEAILAVARELIEAESSLAIDYLELVATGTLAPIQTLDTEGLLLVAVHCGKIRLLDNAILRQPE
jgi:pantoate--beta-alanine ligase